MKHAEFLTPWQAKGRWFQVFMESDGDAHKITHADINVTVNQDSNILMLPAGYKLIDMKLDINQISSGGIMLELLYDDVNNTQGLYIPDKGEYDYMTVWLYAYKED